MEKFISANIFVTAAILLILCGTDAEQTNTTNIAAQTNTTHIASQTNTTHISGGSTASSNASLTTVTTINPSIPIANAYCLFAPYNGAWDIQGAVVFSQVGGGAVSINGVLSGFLQPWNGNKHGMHIHENGDVYNSCSNTGKHFNPEGTTHGDLNDTVRHVGDLGNVVVNSTGYVNISLVDNLLSLTPGNNHSIIGLSLVVNSGEDDLGKNPISYMSPIDGNSGSNIACCKITFGSLPITPTSSADGVQPMILTTFIYSIFAAISQLSRH